jgi:long-chain acyl-CoA synthetase
MLRPAEGHPRRQDEGGDVSASTSGNLADLVRAAATADPGKAALLFHGSTTTWGELDAQVSAAARGLLALGATPGDRVALHLGNTPEFVVLYFAALRAGLVALPVNTGYTADELRHVLGDSGARVVVTSSAGAETVRSVDPGLTVVVTGTASYDDLLASTGDLPAVGGGEDLAVVLYTSGTSGRPRGAMLTHRALLANLEQASRIDPPVVAADDVVLLVLPLFHVFGLNAALGSVAWAGATGVLAERFDPVETLALLRRHGVTNVVGAPPMYVAWSMLSSRATASPRPRRSSPRR